MKAHCILHPTKEAKCFCEHCGFICCPEDENNEDHTTIYISNAMATYIQLLLQAKELRLSTLLYNHLLEAVQHQAFTIINQNKVQLKGLKPKIKQAKGKCKADAILTIEKLIENDSSYTELNANKVVSEMEIKLTEMSKKAACKAKNRKKVKGVLQTSITSPTKFDENVTNDNNNKKIERKRSTIFISEEEKEEEDMIAKNVKNIISTNSTFELSENNFNELCLKCPPNEDTSENLNRNTYC